MAASASAPKNAAWQTAVDALQTQGLVLPEDVAALRARAEHQVERLRRA